MSLNPKSGTERALGKEELALATTLVFVLLESRWERSGQTLAGNVSDTRDGEGAADE